MTDTTCSRGGSRASLQRRQPMRMREYDYGSPGAYFVTICAHGHEALSNGEVVNVITAAWQAIPERFTGVEIDAFVVMPNHVHGIILITDSAQRVSERRGGGAPHHVGAALETGRADTADGPVRPMAWGTGGTT